MSDEFQREQELFDAAIQLPPADRAAMLDKSCADDRQLRQRVEALLKSHELAGGVLDRPNATETPLIGVLREQAGDRIGRYKLLEMIGEGGCGVVYMAEQEAPVRRRVALKIIKLGMDTRQLVVRFEAERQALAMMDHPNIAKVFDAGATETGRPYFVMELVRGTKITDYCDQNNFSTRERLDLFLQACRAVQHAHQKGVIHRDIKPSNILVTLHDGEPTVKIIDFGIAKAVSGQRLTDQTLFTAFEQFVGTPAYMSPEQAQSTTHDIDTRTDIYSLGVLLYELMTGRTPFETRELMQSGLDAMLRTLREKEPLAPSTRLSTLSGDELAVAAKHRQTESPKLLYLLSGDLDWIVMKCLEKNRARRYETVNGLAMDIRRHLNREAVLARPPSNFYRFQRFVRRNRLVVASIGGIIVALLLGLGFSTRAFLKERQARRRATEAESAAQLAHAEAHTEAIKSREVAAFLKHIIEDAGASAALGPDKTTLREVLDRMAGQLGKGLSAQPEVEAELRSILGSAYLKLRENGKAEAMTREALRLRRQVFGETNRFVAESFTELARALVNQGRTNEVAEAEGLARKVLSLWQSLPQREPEAEARSLYVLGSALQRQDKLQEAETAYRRALEIQRKVLKDHPEVANSLYNLAGVLRGQARRDEAEALLREGLAMDQKLLGDEHPDVLTFLNSLASLLTAQHKPAEAEPLAREALAIRRKLFGNEHIEVARSLANLAHILGMQGNVAEAEPLFREALAMRRKLMGDESPDVVWSLASLAAFLQRQGRDREAEPLLRELLKLRRKQHGNENLTVAEAINRLTAALAQQGKLAEAASLARECLAIREKLIPTRLPTFEAKSALGGILLQQLDYARAEPLLLDAYQGVESGSSFPPALRDAALKNTALQLVRLYETTSQTNRASEWRSKLADTRSTAN